MISDLNFYKKLYEEGRVTALGMPVTFDAAEDYLLRNGMDQDALRTLKENISGIISL